MSTNRSTKKINSKPEFVCDMIVSQAVNTKVTDTARRIFNKKPYYMLYEQERKNNGQTLQ